MPADEELWKIIEELPRYQVSNWGRVKSLIGEEKILTPKPDSKGYLLVKLSKQPEVKGRYITKDFRIHRLVAKYFCENYAEGKEVHHKNLRRGDNRACNLLCLTKAEHAALHRKLREQAKQQKTAADEQTKGVLNDGISAKLEIDNGQQGKDR